MVNETPNTTPDQPSVVPSGNTVAVTRYAASGALGSAERESTPVLARAPTQKERDVIRQLQSIVSSANPEKPTIPGIEYCGRGIQTLVYRVSPHLVLKIAMGETKGLEHQFSEMNVIATHVGACPHAVEERTIDDSKVWKIADGVPACAFITEDDGSMYLLSEYAEIAEDWQDTSLEALLPTLEEQGIGLSDFRTPKNFGQVERDGQCEPIVADLGSLRLLAHLDMTQYAHHKQIALARARGEIPPEILR